MSIYVLSARGLWSSVSYDPIFELENLLVQTCNGQLLVPTARGVTRWVHESPNLTFHYLSKVINRTMGYYKPLDSSFQSLEQNVLFIIGLNGGDLKMLSAIPKWRQHFDIVAAYIFDSWGDKIYPKYTHQIDHLFVPMLETIEPLQEYLNIPISLLPFGSDVLTHGSSELNRPIDLISYGRIPAQYNSAFTDFNRPASGRIYYRPSPRPVEQFPKTSYEDRIDKEDRMLLFKNLRMTKLALAFDTTYPGMRQFPYSFVTLRWFECGATGCAIVGKRPITPLVNELLDWEDATIELPDDPQESRELVEELLQDKPRLHSIQKRNYVENLARHDWRFRIKSMLERLGIPLPERLADELSQMKTLHAQQMSI